MLGKCNSVKPRTNRVATEEMRTFPTEWWQSASPPSVLHKEMAQKEEGDGTIRNAITKELNEIFGVDSPRQLAD